MLAERRKVFIHCLFFIYVFSALTDLITGFPTKQIGSDFVLKFNLNLFLVTPDSGYHFLEQICRIFFGCFWNIK